jgi:phage I-like protein
VLLYDPRSGEIAEIQMGALTNFPAIDGMAAIEARAAARSTPSASDEELPEMNKHLLALCVALALTTDNLTEEQLEAAALKQIKDLQAAGDMVALRKELGLADDANAAAINTAVAALKSKATAGTGDPDPAKYVPVGVVEELTTQIAALSATNTAREVDDLVKPALADGRLLPAQEEWARNLGKKDVAALKGFLDTAQPIAALRGSQTDGQAPAGTKDENGLTPGELAVCKATGVDPKDYAKNKPAATAA